MYDAMIRSHIYDPGREILLELIGPPAMDAATAETARDLLSKGAVGGWLSIGHQFDREEG